MLYFVDFVYFNSFPLIARDHNITVYNNESLQMVYNAFNATIIGVAPITQVTHVRNKKNSNTQWSSPNVVKVIFHTLRNCS